MNLLFLRLRAYIHKVYTRSRGANHARRRSLARRSLAARFAARSPRARRARAWTLVLRGPNQAYQGQLAAVSAATGGCVGTGGWRLAAVRRHGRDWRLRRHGQLHSPTILF